MTSTEYVELKQLEAVKYNDAWEITISNLKPDEEKEIKELLNSKFPNYDSELVGGVLTPKDQYTALNNFSKSLFNDIKVYTDGNYQKLYSKTDIGLIQRGSIEAGCVSMDDMLKPFDNNGYAILLNIGLYYSINLLTKGIIVEELQNEWAKYKKSSFSFLDNALEIYLHSNTKVLENIKFNEFPKDIQHELSTLQSNTTVRIMQFIALHEFGHIVNGDFGIMSLYHDSVMGKKIKASSDTHLKEFNADIFAIQALLDNLDNDRGAWGSFYAISFLLAWIWGVEKILNTKISTVHPDPIDRIWNIYEQMRKKYEDTYDYKTLVINAIQRIELWTKNYK